MTGSRILAAALATLAWPLATMAAPVLIETPAAPTPYVVKPGDTLSTIAQRYLTHVNDYHPVQGANKITRPRRLRAGSTLMLPHDLLRGSDELAKVITFSGDAVVARGETQTHATVGADVRQSDVLITGPNAFMCIELADGAHVCLPSQSTVTVARLRRVSLTQGREVDFLVTKGRTQSTVTKLVRPEDHFRVHTPVSVAAVRGTQFRVGFDTVTGHSAVEVLEGLVGVTGRDKGPGITVPSMSGVTSTESEVNAAQALLPAPRVVKPGRTQTDPTMTFSLEPVAGAAGYRGQLANDAGFLDLFNETESKTPSLNFPGPPDGTYFVRVSAMADGMEGAPKVYAFSRELFTPGGPPQPSSVGGQKRFGFKWFGGAADARFQFQLSRNQGFTDLVADQSGLKEKQLVLTDLPVGAYWWRVIVSKVRDGRVQFDAGPAQAFEVAGG